LLSLAMTAGAMRSGIRALSQISSCCCLAAAVLTVQHLPHLFGQVEYRASIYCLEFPGLQLEAFLPVHQSADLRCLNINPAPKESPESSGKLCILL
jgi:hypothetical protein